MQANWLGESTYRNLNQPFYFHTGNGQMCTHQEMYGCGKLKIFMMNP